MVVDNGNMKFFLKIIKFSLRNKKKTKGKKENLVV